MEKKPPGAFHVQHISEEVKCCSLFSSWVIIRLFHHAYTTLCSFQKKYIFSSRLENPKYEPKIWNLGGTIDLSIPRTNSAIEGRHRSLNSTFFTNKVSLPLLIEKLKDEEDQITIKYIRACCGGAIPRISNMSNKKTAVLNLWPCIRMIIMLFPLFSASLIIYIIKQL